MSCFSCDVLVHVSLHPLRVCDLKVEDVLFRASSLHCGLVFSVGSWCFTSDVRRTSLLLCRLRRLLQLVVACMDHHLILLQVMAEADLLRSVFVFVLMWACTFFALCINMRFSIPLLHVCKAVAFGNLRWRTEFSVGLFAFFDLGRSSLGLFLGLVVWRR